jgi:hypothetical protein
LQAFATALGAVDEPPPAVAATLGAVVAPPPHAANAMATIDRTAADFRIDTFMLLLETMIW